MGTARGVVYAVVVSEHASRLLHIPPFPILLLLHSCSAVATRIPSPSSITDSKCTFINSLYECPEDARPVNSIPIFNVALHASERSPG